MRALEIREKNILVWVEYNPKTLDLFLISEAKKSKLLRDE